MAVLHHLYGALRWTWTGTGYNVVSGPLSNVGLLVAVVVWVRSRNCHRRWCPFPSWHEHPENGHPVCKRHHPCDKATLMAKDDLSTEEVTQ